MFPREGGSLGLEKWEDSDLRIKKEKGFRSEKSPRSRSRGGEVLEAYLPGGRWRGAGRGGVVKVPEDRGWAGDTPTPWPHSP